MHQLKERNHTWDNFLFKVLNPHLNVWKHPWHIHDRKPSQTPPTEKKRPKIVHIDEDTPEASLSSHSPTPVNLMSVEFLHVPQIWTKSRKEKPVQTIVQPTVHADHPDRMVEVGGLVSDSPLFTLASVLVLITRGFHSWDRFSICSRKGCWKTNSLHWPWDTT